MTLFFSILTWLTGVVFGFYYGVWYLKRKYLDLGKQLLLVLDCDAYNLDFLTGAGVTLNTIFENKLDCNVKLALTKKILEKRKNKPTNEKRAI